MDYEKEYEKVKKELEELQLKLKNNKKQFNKKCN